MNIYLDFGKFTLEGELFDTEVAKRFYKILPCKVELTGWSKELYGPIGVDLGEEDPVREIPSGGIAYTNQGNYLCLFFGQRPAWAVEHIGTITSDYSRLNDTFTIVKVSKCEVK